MARIFVCYSRADRRFVDEFVPLLRTVYGLGQVWFDGNIPGGHDWWKLILDQIAQCELFVYLLSNEALASQHCQAEFQEALRLQKSVLPVIIRAKTQITDTLPDDVRQFLQQKQWVDLSQGFEDAQASAELYAAIRRLLEQSSSQSVAPSMEPLTKAELSPERREAAKESIIDALTNTPYSARTVERLSIIAGISESQTLDILSIDLKVVFGKLSDGRRTARLVSRSR